MSSCLDNSGDHRCDVCDLQLSTCLDSNGDHSCDVCNAIISECVDVLNDSICDICGKFIAWLTVTTDENCLVNGEETKYVLSQLSSYLVFFDYLGSKNVSYWIIYDSNGQEFARVNDGEEYLFTVGGEYHASAVFSN